MVLQWILRLSKLEFDVVQRSGMKNQVADALSRPIASETDNSSLDDQTRELTKIAVDTCRRK